MLGPTLIREILYEVLRGPNGHVLRNSLLREGSTNRVAQAVTFVEKNYQEPLDVETLARQAGMSTSALHHHFKQATALSPMQYVKKIRLHQARALLLSGRAAAEAAFEVGYNSPSQFSREFRRLFGVSPKEMRVG